MLGPGQWPENGEIDIMEDVNSLSELSGTVHCGTDPGGPCNEPNGIGSGLVGCSGCQSGYHTYTMILNRTNTSAESITFYLDGNAYFTVTEAQVGTATWQAAFDHNLSIILDLAMGGGLPERRLQLHLADQLHRIRRHDERRLRRRVLHQRRRRRWRWRWAAPGRRGRSPATRACASTSGERTAPTSPLSRCTPATAPTPSSGPSSQAGSTLHALGKCMDINGGGTADGRR